jgi:aryl-alcohol dehydrogenase-like predicted oxidoreductase
MAELAMRYVLLERRISSTIPGARSIEQLKNNIENALAPPLTVEEISEIEKIQEG